MNKCLWVVWAHTYITYLWHWQLPDVSAKETPGWAVLNSTIPPLSCYMRLSENPIAQLQSPPQTIFSEASYNLPGAQWHTVAENKGPRWEQNRVQEILGMVHECASLTRCRGGLSCCLFLFSPRDHVSPCLVWFLHVKTRSSGTLIAQVLSVISTPPCHTHLLSPYCISSLGKPLNQVDDLADFSISLRVADFH